MKLKAQLKELTQQVQALKQELAIVSKELRYAELDLILLRNDEKYVVNEKTGKYHRKNCARYLETEFSGNWASNDDTRADLEQAGFRPCILCVYSKSKPWHDRAVVNEKLDELG